MRVMFGSVVAWVVSTGCTPTESTVVAASTGTFCSTHIEDRDEGAGLFKNKTFSGNGRTCATCHPAETLFTLSPDDVKKRFEDRSDPLFLHDGSDDGLGLHFERILNEATILITRPLPPHVVLKDRPLIRSITVPRAIPTLFDLGVQQALQTPLLMADGRFTRLEDQALGAVVSHNQSRKVPGLEQQQTLAMFQTSEAFFSSPELAELACGGPDVGLPVGNTESERRGRRFFVAEPQPEPGEGPEHLTCAGCHSGPLLNEVKESAGPVDDGHRFMDVFVSTLRAKPERLMDLVVTHPDGGPGTVNTLTTADPGMLLSQGTFRCQPVCTTNSVGFKRCGGCIPCSNFVEFNPSLRGREDNVCALLPGITIPPPVGNNFKIPSLRNISKTAPYFHDNSAATLEQVLDHYQVFFELQFRRTYDTAFPLDGRLTAQDVADIIAFMKLL